MSISLNNIKSFAGSKRSKKRVGRGVGSTGTTAGRGQKGQKSRSGTGGFKRLGMRKLILSTPKLRGFKSLNADAQVVNLSRVASAFSKGEIVSPQTLKAKKLVAKQNAKVKVLGGGEISVSLSFVGCEVSKTAAEKIIAAGGQIKA
jgi:large subunit ribosomal protein L15